MRFSQYFNTWLLLKQGLLFLVLILLVIYVCLFMEIQYFL